MFGVKMLVNHKGVKVNLRKFSKDDLPELVKNFDSMKIHLYTNGLFAQTLENEQEWYEKNRKDQDSCIWLIQPEGVDVPIGVTGLHGLTTREGTCTSGITIWDQNWWGKGIATAAHLGRTYFAANYLNRFTIRSHVRVENAASRKALERVGYTVWGQEPVDDFREGRWMDTYHLIWFRPSSVNFMFPGGVPEKYLAGIERAKLALELAQKEVFFP